MLRWDFFRVNLMLPHNCLQMNGNERRWSTCTAATAAHWTLRKLRKKNQHPFGKFESFHFSFHVNFFFAPKVWLSFINCRYIFHIYNSWMCDQLTMLDAHVQFARWLTVQMPNFQAQSQQTRKKKREFCVMSYELVRLKRVHSFWFPPYLGCPHWMRR